MANLGDFGLYRLYPAQAKLAKPPCRPKRGWETKAQAEAQLRSITKRVDAGTLGDRRAGDKLETYRCKHCKKYHVGHAR